MDRVDVLIIGAGVVGLAAACELSKAGKDVLLAEKMDAFGKHTSSRNSEVIHAGMYYPESSLKASLCMEGRKLLYSLAEKNKIPCKKTGKLIIASEENEIAKLEEIFRQGKANKVEGLKMLGRKKIEELEPEVSAPAAVYSPETGIIDSHSLMKYFESAAESSGASIVYEAGVTAIEKDPCGYGVFIQNAGEETEIKTGCIINSAGLDADTIAEMAGIDIHARNYHLRYSRGRYFRVSGRKAKTITRPVYPVPSSGSAGLGIHATPDLAGGLRLGPDDEYLPGREKDYSVDANLRKKFYLSAKKFMPSIEEDDLSPDFAGIRPKIEAKDGEFRDFIIRDEKNENLPGFINLIGIESPGLTAAPAIARMVCGLVEG